MFSRARFHADGQKILQPRTVRQIVWNISSKQHLKLLNTQLLETVDTHNNWMLKLFFQDIGNRFETIAAASLNGKPWGS